MRPNYNYYKYNKIRFAKNNNMNINNKEPSELDLKQIIDDQKIKIKEAENGLKNKLKKIKN